MLPRRGVGPALLLSSFLDKHSQRDGGSSAQPSNINMPQAAAQTWDFCVAINDGKRFLLLQGNGLRLQHGPRPHGGLRWHCWLLTPGCSAVRHRLGASSSASLHGQFLSPLPAFLTVLPTLNLSKPGLGFLSFPPSPSLCDSAFSATHPLVFWLALGHEVHSSRLGPLAPISPCLFCSPQILLMVQFGVLAMFILDPSRFLWLLSPSCLQ